MRTEQTIQIHCAECEVVVGGIVAEPIPEKPGFFRNVCHPNPMPIRCGSCDGILTRKLEGI